MNASLALRELIDFAENRLPKKHHDEFLSLAIRALKAGTDSKLAEAVDPKFRTSS